MYISLTLTASQVHNMPILNFLNKFSEFEAVFVFKLNYMDTICTIFLFVFKLCNLEYIMGGGGGGGGHF